MATVNEELRDSFVRHQIFLMQTVGPIQDEVISIVDKTEADMVAKIKKATAKSADRLTPQNNVRLQRLQKDLAQLRGVAWNEGQEAWAKHARDLVKNEADFLASAFETVSPVVLETAAVSPLLLRTIVSHHPFEGKTLKGWASNIKQADLNGIMDQVRIGMIQGEASDVIARRIVGTVSLKGADGVTQISRRNAAAISRTMVNSFANQTKQEFYRENEEFIQEEIYVATLDARTTPICMSLDGKKFPVGKGAVPPLHFACRSLRVAVLDGKGLIGDRPFKAASEKQLLKEFAEKNKLKTISNRRSLPRGFKGKFDKFARKRGRELTGTVPAQVTYQQWLKKQSAAFQDDVLGKAKGRLFRKGGLSVDKFVNARGRTLTIKELRAKDIEAFRKAGLEPAASTLAKKQGIGDFAIELIQDGKTNAEVLTAVLERFPNAKTTQSSIAWYRSQVKKSGGLPPEPPTVAPKTPPPSPVTASAVTQNFDVAFDGEFKHALSKLRPEFRAAPQVLIDNFKEKARKIGMDSRLLNDKTLRLNGLSVSGEAPHSQVLGQFDPSKNTINLFQLSDNVFIHEYFHHLDFQYLKPAKSIFKVDKTASVKGISKVTRSVPTKRKAALDALGFNRTLANQARQVMNLEFRVARENALTELVKTRPVFARKIDDFNFERQWRDTVKLSPTNVPRPSSYALHSLDEWIAESGMLLFENPEKLERVAPNTFRVLNQFIKGEFFK